MLTHTIFTHTVDKQRTVNIYIVGIYQMLLRSNYHQLVILLKVDLDCTNRIYRVYVCNYKNYNYTQESNL